MQIDLTQAVPYVAAFILVVSRLTGMFMLAPVFSSPMIPAKVKAGALVALGATLTPILGVHLAVPDSLLILVLLILKELFVGVAMGFAIMVVFSAVQVGASLIDMTIGFSLANVIDPSSKQQTTVTGSFYTMIATLTFLSVNGHAWMIAGFAKSFNVISIGAFPNFHRMLVNSTTIFEQLFAMGFEIAAPVLVALLISDVVLGITARVVPQMNVFFVGIPVKIAVGLGAVAIGMPTFVSFMEARIGDVVQGATVLAGVAS